MTETLAYINNSLKELYPPGEIRSFIGLIMDHVCGLQTYQVLMGKGKELSATQTHAVRQIVERLKREEPIQYILGKTSFGGLNFLVDRRVLIPRPETEELVAFIVKEQDGKKVRILDIGTGSGCIAVALAHNLPGSDVVAVDVSEDALERAAENARINKAGVSFIQTDILLPQQAAQDIASTFDLIVSNPPYVQESEKATMGKNVLLYEPLQALFVADSDPLAFYRAIARFSEKKLRDDGVLYFEINALFGRETLDLLTEEGYAKTELIRDLSGKDRIIKARK
jgi:release factor glutamine methyltransferase